MSETGPACYLCEPDKYVTMMRPGVILPVCEKHSHAWPRKLDAPSRPDDPSPEEEARGLIERFWKNRADKLTSRFSPGIRAEFAEEVARALAAREQQGRAAGRAETLTECKKIALGFAAVFMSEDTYGDGRKCGEMIAKQIEAAPGYPARPTPDTTETGRCTCAHAPVTDWEDPGRLPDPRCPVHRPDTTEGT